ncbi:MAG: ATP-binding protein [Myxococcales bacterium]|nr:ATP-binding protein [Myxococcales bacterium]
MSRDSVFPSWWPEWAAELGRVYYAGNTSTFLITGNVDDLVRVERPRESASAGLSKPGASGNDDTRYMVLSEFLASQLFGAWDLVLYYDMSRPPRPLTGEDKDRLAEMNRHMDRHIGDRRKMPRDPTKVLALLNAYVELMLVGKREEERPSVAVIVDFAHLLLPRTSVAHTSENLAANLVTVLNWARNPYIKRVNFSFVLLSEKASDVSEAVVSSAHVQRVERGLPDRTERLAFIDWMRAGRDFSEISEVTPDNLASLTAGLTLVDVQGLMMSAIRTGDRITLDSLKDDKKELIESACAGMVELVEPEHELDMVVGHDAAKKRLREDARLIREGHLDAAPMGYLMSGPVGTGKSFLAECYAGTVGIPTIKLLNFRSKYVGETEGNLEKILKVLRVMGPVSVVIDEADAALGNREAGGDSGTSNRVFAQIAQQMGNTKYRGKIIWFLMTCRPDRLPIDLKRQGRAEVHIALFYPQGEQELRQMFIVMGKKNGVAISDELVPPLGDLKLSGADIEGVVGRAKRLALLDGRRELSKEDIASALENFIPSAEDAEKRLQELAAILECTEADMLPEDIRAEVRDADGKSKMLRRFEALRAQLE